MHRLIDYISRSTLKREYAVGMTMFWMWLTATATTDQDVKIVEMITYPILIGCFGVFGLDWAAKQTTLAGPPQNEEAPIKIEQKITAPKDAMITTNVDQQSTKIEVPKDDGFA